MTENKKLIVVILGLLMFFPTIGVILEYTISKSSSTLLNICGVIGVFIAVIVFIYLPSKIKVK